MLKKLGFSVLLTIMATTLVAPRSLPVKGGGRITYAKGIVNVRRRQIVRPGRVIFTGKTGRVEITFSDGSRLRIGPNSHFKLVSYNSKKRRTVARLRKGRVWARIRRRRRNRVIVHGRYSTAAVLGTTWNFDVSDTSTKTTVIKGSVAVHRPFDLKDEQTDQLFVKTPQPLFAPPKAPPSGEIGLQPPTEISSPVHEVSSPIKVVPGPFEVSKEQWLEIVQGQQIYMGKNGQAVVSKINAIELAKKDPWFKWNQQMDNQVINETE